MKKITVFFALLIILFISFLDTFFIVDQGSQAIVLQFGKVVSEELANPGLHFKYPLINKVVYFEKKLLGFSSEMREAIASDQKRILVNTYTKYKIINPLQFYQSVRNEQNLANRVSPIVESATREAIAKTNLNCFVSECRINAMKFIKENASINTKDFGIQIVDVRIKTVALPNENLESIFSRMKTDRNKEAKEIRATGAQEPAAVHARAARGVPKGSLRLPRPEALRLPALLLRLRRGAPRGPVAGFQPRGDPAPPLLCL